MGAVEKYKMKFSLATGDIVELGSSVSPAGDGQAIEDFIGEHPGVLEHVRRVSPGKIEAKTDAEKEEANKKIRPIAKSKFLDRLAQLPKEKKDAVVQELLARIAVNVLTEEELEALVK